jgi:hypothetical protein
MGSQTRILHPEFRLELETTKYPFADTATLTNTAGDFVPETLFLDAHLYPVGAGARLFLSQVVVTHSDVTLILADTRQKNLASVTFDLYEPPDLLSLADAYGRPAGILVSETLRLASFQAWSAGTHNFTVDQTEFVASCCMPTPEPGLRGFILDDGSVITDDAWLIGDDGVVLAVEDVVKPAAGCNAAETYQVIRVHVVGDPLYRRRLCSGSFTTPNYLRTITVKHDCRKIICGPDASGDFKITAGSQFAADTILRLRATPDGLKIEAVGEVLANVFIDDNN